jgi:uncharacterized membrane protein YfcA
MLYLLIGLGVGALGTLVGIGGGIILVPLLFQLHPEMPPEQVTALSLLCIALSAVSGSVQFLIKKQIHIRAGLLFAIWSVPGVLLGVWATERIERGGFEAIYAGFITVMATYLLIRSYQDRKVVSEETLLLELPVLGPRQYTLGSVMSVWIGFVAGFFGVGGGIVHVPFLNRVLKFPIRYAAATSQFILALTTLVAVGRHFFSGSFRFIAIELSGSSFIVALAIGMVLGAQIGAWGSRQIKAAVIVRILAVLLFAVAGKIAFF